jgi:ABC-type antimicrobial peptide transport system permease subunit
LAPSTFEPERLLTVQADPGIAGYTQERSLAFFEEAVRRLESLPGVASATVSSGNGFFSFISAAGGRVRVVSDHVAPRFFETMNISVLLGRDLTWSDKKGSALVVVVNEAFARTVHPGANPLGQTVRIRGGQAEIVGVVADSNNSVGDAFGMGQSVQPAIYIPFQQQQTAGFWGSMILSVRVNSDASALASAVRRTVADVDANVIVDEARTQASQMSFRFRERQLVVAILTLAGLIALIEVAFGIYGTLSFFVGTRTSEIGLRIALGAQRLDVIGMIFRQSLIPVAIGILAGLIGAPVLARVLDSNGFLMVPIRPMDELAIIGAALLLLGVALAAAFAPARRASRLAPMQALRHD